jgi:hypothetical protein
MRSVRDDAAAAFASIEHESRAERLGLEVRIIACHSSTPKPTPSLRQCSAADPAPRLLSRTTGSPSCAARLGSARLGSAACCKLAAAAARCGRRALLAQERWSAKLEAELAELRLQHEHEAVRLRNAADLLHRERTEEQLAASSSRRALEGAVAELRASCEMYSSEVRAKDELLSGADAARVQLQQLLEQAQRQLDEHSAEQQRVAAHVESTHRLLELAQAERAGAERERAEAQELLDDALRSERKWRAEAQQAELRVESALADVELYRARAEAAKLRLDEVHAQAASEITAANAEVRRLADELAHARSTADVEAAKAAECEGEARELRALLEQSRSEHMRMRKEFQQRQQEAIEAVHSATDAVDKSERAQHEARRLHGELERLTTLVSASKLEADDARRTAEHADALRRAAVLRPQSKATCARRLSVRWRGQYRMLFRKGRVCVKWNVTSSASVAGGKQ